MSILADYADMLHTYNVQAVRIVQGDYGRDDSVEPITDVMPISGQKASSREKNVAGVEAAVEAYKLYSGPDLDERITEKTTLLLSRSDGSEVGRLNVRSRVDYKGEAAILEADMLNTQ